jgi:hypothetical protein
VPNKHRWLASYAKKNVINTDAATQWCAAIQNTSESGRQLILASLSVRLSFGQLAFPYDAFVRLVNTLNPILVLAGTLRQGLGDHINTAGGVAADWGQELYELADAKFMVWHGVSTPRRKSVYHIAVRLSPRFAS